ncbi:M4 family metallopeptidase [Hyalangium minutum]
MSRIPGFSPEEVVRLSKTLVKTFCAAWLGLAFTACDTTEQQQVDADDVMTLSAKDGSDIQQALGSLPSATVLGVHEKDAVPFMIKGQLGTSNGSAVGLAVVDAKAAVQTALSQIAPVFRLRADDLVVKRVSQDEMGHQHIRLAQTKNGLPVINGELILHVDKAGNVYAANGDARDDQGAVTQLKLVKAKVSAEAAAVAASDSTEGLNKSAKAERLVYVRDTNENLVLAHEVRVTGARLDGIPVEDLVYVNANNGTVALRAPKVYTALNRAVYSANNGTSLPGTLKRSEGGAAANDTHVDQNYTRLGKTYECYSVNFGRDSYNGSGAQLKSTVHYSSNYVNAYWNSSQMVYGDGNGTDSTMLGLDADVTTHELTHAVTEYESNLTYSGESGGLNESMSDIFGAYCESWEASTTNGGTWPTTADIWMVGEDIWTPGTPNDALRYMDDPAKDGASKDLWTSSAGSVDVHYSSGISNLAFALLSKGGTHPRGKTTVSVTGIGVQKAGAIFYKANKDLMTASTTFNQAKTYTEQAADALGYTAEKASVTAAWQAVGVGGGTTPPPSCTSTIVLSNGVAATNVGATAGNFSCTYTLTVPSGQTSLSFALSGGTGDGDMYVKFGTAPTTSVYDCRPYTSGNAETCNFTNPAAGTWYVKVNAYSDFSGASLKGTYSGGTTPPGDTLTNGVATAAYSGAASSQTCWTLTVPAGKSVVFAQAGGTGDADLYVRKGSAPTTTTYDCRPYLSGNNESCSFAAGTASVQYYACSRGYSAYTGVTMKGTY